MSSTLVPICVVTVHIRDVTYTNWFFTSLLIIDFRTGKNLMFNLRFLGIYASQNTEIFFFFFFLLVLSGIVLSDFAIKILHLTSILNKRVHWQWEKK